MDISNSSIEDSEISGEHSRQTQIILENTSIISHHEWTVRNTDIKGAAGEDSEENGNMLRKTGGKGILVT